MVFGKKKVVKPVPEFNPEDYADDLEMAEEEEEEQEEQEEDEAPTPIAMRKPVPKQRPQPVKQEAGDTISKEEVFMLAMAHIEKAYSLLKLI